VTFDVHFDGSLRCFLKLLPKSGRFAYMARESSDRSDAMSVLTLAPVLPF